MRPKVLQNCYKCVRDFSIASAFNYTTENQNKLITFCKKKAFSCGYYVPDAGNTDPSTVWGSTYVHDAVPEKFECKLTEVTSTYVKGTFSADIYKNESGTPQKIVVTDGEFYVKFL